MRADRLLSILLQLQLNGKMTSVELAKRLEVSERTIHRDMEALSASGIPLYAERGTTGGWCLAEGYRTQLTGLKTEELHSLLLLNPSQLMADLGMTKHFESAFLKLMVELPTDFRSNAEYIRKKIHVDGAGWHRSKETFPNLPMIQEAVWAEVKLHIRYQKEGDREKEEEKVERSESLENKEYRKVKDARDKDILERTVDPLGLVAKGNTWYLVASTDNGLRTFRISRVVEARVSTEHFVWPEAFDLADYWEQSIASFKDRLPQYHTVIKFHEKLLPKFTKARYTKVQHIRSHDQTTGWITADIQFDTLEFACEFILGYGGLEVEVLEPEPLRSMVIEQAKAIMERYGYMTMLSNEA